MGEFDFGGGYDFGNVAQNLDLSMPNTSVDFSTPPPMPGPASSGWGSFGDVASNIKGGIKSVVDPIADIGRAVSPLATIGGAVMGGIGSIRGANQLAEQNQIARRAEGMQERQAGAAAAAAQPLVNFGTKTLDAVTQGQIPPAIQSKIDLWVAGAKQKMHDYLARSGQGDSDTLAKLDNWIEQQGMAMAADYLTQEQQIATGAIAQGASAIGGAGQLAHGVGATAAGQQDSLGKLIADANEQIARLGGGAAN